MSGALGGTTIIAVGVGSSTTCVSVCTTDAVGVVSVSGESSESPPPQAPIHKEIANIGTIHLRICPPTILLLG